MFKNIFNIIQNRAKVGLVEYVMQILISALHEYQRSSQSGEFDIRRQNQEREAFNTSENAEKLPTINNSKGFLDFLNK